MESKLKRVEVMKAHVAINVRNVERSMEFYKKMLGIEPVKVRRGYAKFDVQNPPLNLTLNQVPFGERGALSHMGLQVAATDDVFKMRERWQAAGLETRDEMQTNCCYALQDKTWVKDPDGNEWEVFVVLKDNLAETALCCGTDAVEQSDADTTSCATGVSAATTQNTSCCAPAPVGIAR